MDTYLIKNENGKYLTMQSLRSGYSFSHSKDRAIVFDDEKQAEKAVEILKLQGMEPKIEKIEMEVKSW